MLFLKINAVDASKINDTSWYDVNENKEQQGHSTEPHDRHNNSKRQSGVGDASILWPSTLVLVLNTKSKVSHNGGKQNEAKKPRQDELSGVHCVHVVTVIEHNFC